MMRRAKLSELREKFWKRVSVFSLGLAVLVLIDEWIKEGYVFNPDDISCIGSHETIFILFVFISLFAHVKHMRNKKKRGGG